MIPEQVVLGSGGVLGDTWMSGMIAGLLDAGGPDLRQSQQFVGTSAGSIVATRLAAGVDMREYLDRRFQVERSPVPDSVPEGPLKTADFETGSDRAAAGALGGAAAALLNVSRPAGAMLRRLALRALPVGGEELSRLGQSIDRLMPVWDARLSVIGVDFRRGSRLVIDADSDLGLSVSEAVRASCAIPGVFTPIESSRGPVVDGGVWSPVNLDAVRPTAGATVLCLYPSGYHSRPRRLRRSAATGASRTRVAIEAAALRRDGVRVSVIPPDPAAAEAIGPNRMDHSRDQAAASAGYRQGMELAGRL